MAPMMSQVNLAPHSPMASPPSSSNQGVKKALIAIAAVFALIVLGVGGYQVNEVLTERRIEAQRAAEAKAAAEAARKLREAEEAELRRAIADDSWLPSGFTKFPMNPYMAYKKNGASCEYYGVCFPFDLITSKYCSSVYIQGNLVIGGTIYEWANDSAQGVSAGDRVRMRLQFIEDRGGNISWTDATCR